MITEHFFDSKINVGSMLHENYRIFIDTFIKESEENYTEMKMFYDLTLDKKCLLDVGCAMGMFSLVFCKDQSKVAHAFDASHITQLVVTQNLLLNPDKNIHYHKIFLGNKDAITNYNSNELHALATTGTDRVVMTKMDSFCALGEIEPDVIKIDTEGFEYDVLSGGREAIMMYRPLMFIEFHPKFCQMYGTTIDQAFNMGKELNYTIKDSAGEVVTLDRLTTLKNDSLRTIWYPN